MEHCLSCSFRLAIEDADDDDMVAYFAGLSDQKEHLEHRVAAAGAVNESRMSNNANHAQKRKAEAAERGGNNSSSSNKRFDHGSVNGSSSTQSQYDSRIVRVSRTSGGKDRHSKVFTAKGLRDRRVRLSVSTAIQFYDLQDRLGYDQPSKALEWLIKAAADAIEQLPALHMPPHPHPHHHTPHLPPAPALALTVSQRQQQQATTPPPPSPDVCRKSLSEASSEESHESQKAAAATTQRGVAVEAHIAEQKHDQDHGSRGRRARAAANNNSEPLYAGLSLCRSESRVNARERPKGLAINQDHHRDNEEEEKGGNDRKPKPTTAGFFTDLLQNVVSIDSQSRTSNQSLSQNKDTSQINYRDSPAAAAAAAGVSPRNSAANATGSGLVLKSQLDNVIQISSIEFPVANMKNQNEHQQIPYHHHHSQQQQNNNKPGTGSLDLLHSQSYSFPGSVAVAGTIVSPMATAHRDDNNKACGGGRACVPGLMPNPNAHPFFVNSGSATLMHGNCTTALEGGEIQSKSQAQLFHPDQMLSFPSTVARGLVSSRETLQSNSYQNSSSNSNVMNYFMLTQQQHQQMMLHRLTQQQHLGQAYDVLRIMDKPQQPLTHEFGLHESAGKSSSSPSISKLDTETHQAREKYGYS